MAKHSDILSEAEIKAIDLYLNGNTKLNAFLIAFPDYERFTNSELLRFNDLFWNLPKVNKYVRENQNNSR